MQRDKFYNTLQQEIKGICRETMYPESWLQHHQCPCCSASRISFFCTKFEFAYWVCKDCKFVFMNPYPNDQVTEAIYNSSYYPAVRNHIEIPRALKNLANASQSMADRDYFEVIDLVRHKKEEGKWLDVGGGIGIFLNHVQKKSPRYNLFLNEHNLDSTRFAKNFYNLNVLPLAPEQLLISGETFDIISMLAVLEHISKPYDFLLKYLKLLTETGLLVLTLPNYTRLNRLLSRQHSPNVIPPYHLSLFNPDNIRILLERLNILRRMEIHFSGDSAFKFWHMAKWSEYSDVKIPAPGDLRQIFFLRRQPSFSKKIKLKGFDFLDRRFSRILTKLDGSVLMHIIAHKHGGQK